MAAGQVLNRRSSNIPERYSLKGTPLRLSAHTDALGPDNRVTDGTESWRVSASIPDLLIEIRAHVHEYGLRPETVAERHNLDLADVYHALTYYHDHPGEMEEVEHQRETALEEAAERTTLTPPSEE